MTFRTTMRLLTANASNYRVMHCPNIILIDLILIQSRLFPLVVLAGSYLKILPNNQLSS